MCVWGGGGLGGVRACVPVSERACVSVCERVPVRACVCLCGKRDKNCTYVPHNLPQADCLKPAHVTSK